MPATEAKVIIELRTNVKLKVFFSNIQAEQTIRQTLEAAVIFIFNLDSKNTLLRVTHVQGQNNWSACFVPKLPS